jgi:uncharacterized protein YeaO (DUF488 family)
MIALKRIYEPASADDGYRVLVERLWPRGVSKEAAHLDAWERGIAPSHELRRWYGHDPQKWPEFRVRYERELATPQAQETLDRLAERARQGTVTLLYAARGRRDQQCGGPPTLIDRAHRCPSAGAVRYRGPGTTDSHSGAGEAVARRSRPVIDRTPARAAATPRNVPAHRGDAPTYEGRCP